MKGDRKSAQETVFIQKRPQVLLLGNGMIRSYSSLSMSWKDLVYQIGSDRTIPYSVDIPLPMEIVLRTEGHVADVLRHHQRELCGRIETRKFRDKLMTLLDAGFDDILTTNYSYELEEAASGKEFLETDEIARMRRYIGFRKKHEQRYLLHTYNQIESPSNRIWHIHGEAANVDSIVIGHYYYGNLLYQCQNIVKRREKDHWKYDATARNSWVDAFLTGDVYVLGFGFDYSETDLWWLLSKKARMKRKRTGHVYIYRPKKNDDFDVKYQLLQDYGAQVVDLGMNESTIAEEDDEMFRLFYPMAIEAIIDQMNENRS
ncbi:MAG: SIR2 family protein [Bilifractor sp.]